MNGLDVILYEPKPITLHNASTVVIDYFKFQQRIKLIEIKNYFMRNRKEKSLV